MSVRVKPSFVIFDIRALWRSAHERERQSARMSKITNDGLTRSGAGCYYISTHMATVGVKGSTCRMNAEAKVTDVFSRSSSNTCRTSRTRIQTTGARAYAMTKKDIDYYVDECNAVQINYWSCGQASSVWSSRSVGPLTVQLHFAYRPASIIISRCSSDQSSHLYRNIHSPVTDIATWARSQLHDTEIIPQIWWSLTLFTDSSIF